MSPAEALEIATKTTPQTAVAADPDDPNGLKPGDRVEVALDDYGKIKVAGDIVALSAQHIAIRRHDARAGEVVVHFPRAGFLVTPAQSAWLQARRAGSFDRHTSKGEVQASSIRPTAISAALIADR